MTGARGVWGLWWRSLVLSRRRFIRRSRGDELLPLGGGCRGGADGRGRRHVAGVCPDDGGGGEGDGAERD